MWVITIFVFIVCCVPPSIWALTLTVPNAGANGIFGDPINSDGPWSDYRGTGGNGQMDFSFTTQNNNSVPTHLALTASAERRYYSTVAAQPDTKTVQVTGECSSFVLTYAFGGLFEWEGVMTVHTEDGDKTSNVRVNHSTYTSYDDIDGRPINWWISVNGFIDGYVSFKVDPIIDAAPVVTISRPLANGTVTTYVDLAGTASDYQNVLGVDYVIKDGNGVAVSSGTANQSTGTGTPSKVNWSVDDLFLAPGTYTLTITARDTAGNVSTPLTRSFSVVPSDLTAGDSTTSTLTVSSADTYVSPKPTVFPKAIQGSFSGRVTAAKLLSGNTVSGDNTKAACWWVASEITPDGSPVTSFGGTDYYAANSTLVDASLISTLGGSTKQPNPYTMLISPLVLSSVPLLHSTGFTLTYTFGAAFYASPGDQSRGMAHAAVPLELRLRYDSKEPGSPILYRFRTNSDLLVDLSQGDMANIMTLSSALVYPTGTATFGTGWTLKETANGLVNLTQEARWNAVFDATKTLTNNLVPSTLGQARALGSMTLGTFVWVARNRPSDYVTPASSYPALEWRKRDERTVNSKTLSFGVLLWGAATAETKGGAVVLGTVDNSAPLPGSDRTAPTCKFTAPTANQRVPYATTIAVMGSATDNTGVAAVEVMVEGTTAWVPVTSITPAGGKSVTWNLALSGLKPGAVSLRARAKDAAGNISAQAVVAFTIVRQRSIQFSVTGQGTVNRSTTAATLLDAGSNNSITATPAKGWRFSAWTGTAAPASGANRSPLSFVMPDIDGATLTAVFVADITSGLAGTYDMVFGSYLNPNSPGGLPAAGRVRVTLTNTGGVTGTLTMATQHPAARGVFSLNFSGTLDGRYGYATVLRPSGRPPVSLSFTIDTTGTRLLCKGSILSGAGDTIDFEGGRAAQFTTAAPCPDAGRHFLRIHEPWTQDTPYTEIVTPELHLADGWGVVTISSLGGATTVVRGSLQTTAVTMSAQINEQLEVIFAASMSLGGASHPAGTVAGWCAGQWTYADTGNGWSAFSGPTMWLPLVAPKPTLPSSEALQLEVDGDVPPPAGNSCSWDSLDSPNAVLECWTVDRVPDVLKWLTMDGTVLKGFTPAEKSFTLKLSNTDGSFSGAILMPGRTGGQAYQGIVLWNQDIGVGSMSGGAVRLRPMTADDAGLQLQVSRRITAQSASVMEAAVPQNRTIANPGLSTTGFTLHFRPDAYAMSKASVLRQGRAYTGALGWELTFDFKPYAIAPPPAPLVPYNVASIELTGDSTASSATLTTLHYVPYYYVPITLVVSPTGTGPYTVSLYVSGVSQKSTTVSNFSAFQTNLPLLLGPHYDGSIIGLRIWNRPFSAAEVSALP